MSRTQEVIMHSREWERLVEAGWRTHTVDGRIAVMVYAPPPVRRYY